MSPMQRSLAYLRAQGFFAVVTEHRHFKARNVTLDLWGFCDILALRGPGEIIAVQTTSDTNVSHRVRKIEGLESFPRVVGCGIQVEVHGWKDGRATPRIVVPSVPSFALGS
jgi:hypothetical protein